MTTFFKRLLLATLACIGLQAHAALNVVACEPEWASLAKELGGDKLNVSSATTALQDPHHIEARPSLIARVRGADLLVCTGMELEIGWLPVLVQQSGNAKLSPGAPAMFEAGRFVAPLEAKPGVEPSAGHLTELSALLAQQPAKMVVRAAYEDPRASKWLSEHAKIPAVALPFTVGGNDKAGDLFGLFDSSIALLLE